jgi:cell division protein FtsL
MSSAQINALYLASVAAILLCTVTAAVMTNKHKRTLIAQQKEISRLNRVIEEKAADNQYYQALQRESY